MLSDAEWNGILVETIMQKRGETIVASAIPATRSVTSSSPSRSSAHAGLQAWKHLSSHRALHDRFPAYLRDRFQHNQVMPHWAHKGLTPDEVYFGTDVGIRERLRQEHARARQARLKVNQETTCETCEASEPGDAGEPAPAAEQAC